MRIAHVLLVNSKTIEERQASERFA